ncbi:MAG: hypothetical protein LBG50_03820 [Clostridiales Family XIII bacterium]|jgi:hypothetical protein|nr:hypothetical protein [Clostridiales Family XIII bacterium]
MSLVEVIVAMGILTVVSVMVLSAFTTALNSELNSTEMKNAAAATEREVAHGEPSERIQVTLDMGGFGLKSEADKFEGEKSYTVIESVAEQEDAPSHSMLFGDLTGANIGALENIYGTDSITDVGGIGGVRQYAVPLTGRYMLEVWGAKGADMGDVSSGNYAAGGSGGYARGTVALERGTVLYLCAGGIGRSEASVAMGEPIDGGFNGGGKGRYGMSGGASGGGASDIRIAGDTIYDRAIVAGGGGGASSFGFPGVGGGSSGNDSRQGATVGAQGGGSSSGGDAGGGFAQNTKEFAPGSSGFGGGGGWYAGGSSDSLGGAGGSGWVFTKTAFDAWDPVDGLFSSAADKDGYKVDDHTAADLSTLDGSGYKYSMIDTVLIAGDDPMPSPADPGFDIDSPAPQNNVMGNAHGGCVRVVYLGE